MRGVYTLFALLLLCSSAFAQEFTGNLNGRVTDASGAVIPGVSITLKSPAIQGARTAVTDESGSYRFILITQGDYSVTFELPGFKTLVREGVVVSVGKTTTINVSLAVATMAETVTVTGESPVVDVQNATVAVNFNQSLLRDLPNARDIWVVLAQTPGITTTRFDVGGSTMGTQTGYRSYGLSGQNWITLDGVNTTEGTSGAGFYMDYGAFAEIQVSAAANSAEVPVPGAFLNTVFKSGSNQLHGENYIDFENGSFQGKNIDDRLRNQGIAEGDKFVKYYDFNTQFGGPFQKDKFWWFTSFRNQYSALKTELRQNDGTPGGIFYTRLNNLTIKLNYQLNAKNSLAFSSQGQRKQQPFRGGQGANAWQYVVDSTYYQDSWAWIGKVQWTSVLSNRATLDLSGNHFGYHFPGRARVQQTPTYDDVTQLRRGAYQAPFRDIDRRYHINGALSYFKDNFLGGNHDMKVGYQFIYYATLDLEKGAPGTPGVTPGAVRLVYSAGVPNQIEVTNTPLRANNSEYQNAYFFQDKWQIGRKLTINVGVRYDRYTGYYPEQGYPGTGPFQTKETFPKRTIGIFNNVVPRIAFVYDVLGNTKTALKASYGRYSENIGTSLSSAANPVRTVTKTYGWSGQLPITPQLVAALPLQTVMGQGSLISIDPNLKNAYTDEYVTAIEHQLAQDFGVNVSFVRKIRHNSWTPAVNRAESILGFAPITVIDPGRDGRIGTADDGRFGMFERIVPAATDNYLTTHIRGDNFSTIEIGARKRFSKKWQMIAGWDWTKRNLAPNVSLNPNTLLFGSDTNEHTRLWTYKLIGTYELPRGFALSGTYNAQKGEPYGRRVTVRAANMIAPRTRGLAQGNTTVYLEPEGAYYRPTLHLVNLRVEKTFRIKDRHKVTGMFDLFNVQNANTAVGIDDLTNTFTNPKGQIAPTFGRATQILNPRIFRLGLRYMF